MPTKQLWMRGVLDRLLYRLALPLLCIGAGLLHLYTTHTAFVLAGSKVSGIVAAIAAWITPPIAEFVVAYYAWRASGSMVNAYSVWILAWGILLIGVLSLVACVRLLDASRPAGPKQARDSNEWPP
jgi:hypothetical protein